MFHFKPRFGRVRPFIGISSHEGGRMAGLQAGITTYSPDGTEYQVTHLNYSARCDHLADALCELTGIDTETQLVATAGDDVAYVGTVEQNDRIMAKQSKNAESNDAPVAASPVATTTVLAVS